MDEICKEVEKWMLDEVENVIGVFEEKVLVVVWIMVENCFGILVWCMGGIQYYIGNNIMWVFCIFQLVLGNIGKFGGGVNIFCGYDNVQGVIDVGFNCYILLGYYGLVEGVWCYWCWVWDVDYDWLVLCFDCSCKYDVGDGKMVYIMNIFGIFVLCWIDGVLEDFKNFL